MKHQTINPTHCFLAQCVRIVDQEGCLYRVEFSDGSQGWHPGPLLSLKWATKEMRRVSLGRIAMDEIEFKQMYNECVTLSRDATNRERVLLLLLQLINDLNARMIELQVDDPEDYREIDDE